MKKSIFILAALFAATFAYAQITYERTIHGLDVLHLGSGVEIIGTDYYQRNSNAAASYTISLLGEYVWDVEKIDNTHYIFHILDANTLSVVKSFNVILPSVGPMEAEFGTLVSRGIFTTDSKWAWVHLRSENSKIDIVTEDGSTIATLPWDNNTGRNYSPFILKTKTTYKLVVPNNNSSGNTYDPISFDIYSLPGNGESGQDVIAPVAPRNARKVLKKDQVLIENSDHIFDTQGKMIK